MSGWTIRCRASFPVSPISASMPAARWAASRPRPHPRPIRVVDLLRHTAGFTYGFLNRTEIDAAYRAQRIGEANTEGGLAGMIAQLEKLPLEFAPGEMWNYSVATDVAGWLVEKISGQRFSDFLRTRIFTPLADARHRFHRPRRQARPPCHLLLCEGRQASGVRRRPQLELMPSRRFWNPAAAAWRAPPRIICASAACC